MDVYLTWRLEIGRIIARFTNQGVLQAVLAYSHSCPDLKVSEVAVGHADWERWQSQTTGTPLRAACAARGPRQGGDWNHDAHSMLSISESRSHTASAGPVEGKVIDCSNTDASYKGSCARKWTQHEADADPARALSSAQQHLLYLQSMDTCTTRNDTHVAHAGCYAPHAMQTSPMPPKYSPGVQPGAKRSEAVYSSPTFPASPFKPPVVPLVLWASSEQAMSMAATSRREYPAEIASKRIMSQSHRFW